MDRQRDKREERKAHALIYRKMNTHKRKEKTYLQKGRWKKGEKERQVDWSKDERTETDKQKERKIDRWSDERTDRQTDGQKGRKTDGLRVNKKNKTHTG